MALLTLGLFANPLLLDFVTAVVVPGLEEVCCGEGGATGPFSLDVRFTVLPVPAANNEHSQKEAQHKPSLSVQCPARDPHVYIFVQISSIT